MNIWKKLERNPLWSKSIAEVAKAISRFHLIGPNDRVAVAVSGGKDSTFLLLALTYLRQKAPIFFEIQPVLLDQKQPGFEASSYQKWLSRHLGVNLTILESDTYSIVKAKTRPGQPYCVLCSKFRRAILYDWCHQNGWKSLALGHHRDDFNVTFMLNLFFTGKNATMAIKLISDDGRVQVIRPLVWVPEEWIASIIKDLQVPLIPCRLCQSQEDLKRALIAQWLRDLEKRWPTLPFSLIRSQGNVKLSHLLDDRFWDFAKLKPSGLRGQESRDTLPTTLENDHFEANWSSF